MEPIRVPRPPSQAFNKNRRISDLIRAQTNHLKHVEEKLSPSQRQQIPQHAIVTEADAAGYIAAMTRLFRAQGDSTATPSALQPPTRQPIPIRPATGLQIAAGAEQAGPASPDKSASRKITAKAKKGSPSSKGKKR
jgi:hypothetical protein